MLGWSPSIFWTTTLIEWDDAITGFIEFHGGGGDRQPDTNPLTRSELEDLMKRYPD